MAQVSSQKCSLCDENNGAYYCYECQHALCTVCRKNHGKIPALSGHTVADINRIDRSTLNKKNRCVTHNKEIQIYCEECSNLICIKCVTSTHKSHTISDITDVVVEEREKAKENIKKLKLKTEAISSLQEKIRREHIAKLHIESEKCKGHIESICKDLKSFLEAKGSIKTTEVEDNETIENQNFEAFLKNTDLIHNRYVNILSELENLLLEKHDVTFFSGYRSIQRDIETLSSIPEEPPFARVPRFEDESLYRDTMEHMESKMDKRLCQNCPVQKKQIEDLQSEYNIFKETCHRDLETKDAELKKLSEDINSLKEEKNTMQSMPSYPSPYPPYGPVKPGDPSPYQPYYPVKPSYPSPYPPYGPVNTSTPSQLPYGWPCYQSPFQPYDPVEDVKQRNDELKQSSQEIKSSTEEAVPVNTSTPSQLPYGWPCYPSPYQPYAPVEDVKQRNDELKQTSQEIESSTEEAVPVNTSTPSQLPYGRPCYPFPYQPSAPEDTSTPSQPFFYGRPSSPSPYKPYGPEKDVKQKNDELKKSSQEIESSTEEAVRIKDIDKKNDDLQKMSQEIQSLKFEDLQFKKSANRKQSPTTSNMSRSELGFDCGNCIQNFATEDDSVLIYNGILCVQLFITHTSIRRNYL